jgi:molybdenum cofactor guanylyltransferase
MTIDRSGQFAGFILAGGRSSRMGRDKAMLEIDGVTMLERAIDLVRRSGLEPAIVGSFDETPRGASVREIPDDWPGAGPLGGIATALHGTRTTSNLVIACDMPYLTPGWLEFLLRRARASDHIDAIVPMNVRGPEPLCAVYHQRAEPRIRQALESGIRKITDALAELQIDYVERDEWKAFDSDGLLFKNMNRPADYAEAQAILSRRAQK